MVTGVPIWACLGNGYSRAIFKFGLVRRSLLQQLKTLAERVGFEITVTCRITVSEVSISRRQFTKTNVGAPPFWWGYLL